MKAIKRLFISLVVIVAILGVAVIGGYIYVRSAYGIDLFRTAGQLKTLTEQVNEAELCPNAYGDSDFTDLKNSVNAEIEGLVKFEEGKGYNGYTLDFNALIGAELSKTIALSEKQVGALAQTVFFEQTGGKIQLGGKQTNVTIVQTADRFFGNCRKRQCGFQRRLQTRPFAVQSGYGQIPVQPFQKVYSRQPVCFVHRARR